jgi:riboflavin synthase
MFSGIVEGQGEVLNVEKSGSNLRFHIACPFLKEMKIDQSVAHNGVCLTVTDIDNDGYFVDVIAESLDKSNLGDLKAGSKVNLERSVSLNSLLDGHLVQGHVDQTARVRKIESNDGSWTYHIEFADIPRHTIIEKGSISVNGVSLTISGVHQKGFQVSIIPYTFEHTTFSELSEGDTVNIEFDVIGKYVEKLTRN